jgi:hypothetical protein
VLQADTVPVNVNAISLKEQLLKACAKVQLIAVDNLNTRVLTPSNLQLLIVRGVTLVAQSLSKHIQTSEK